jgi:hypothetical protein
MAFFYQPHDPRLTKPRDASGIYRHAKHDGADNIVSLVTLLLVVAVAYGLYMLYAGSLPSQPAARRQGRRRDASGSTLDTKINEVSRFCLRGLRCRLDGRIRQPPNARSKRALKCADLIGRDTRVRLSVTGGRTATRFPTVLSSSIEL